ncbi:MAG: tRNA-intron lyase [Candidatus Helarchaeota archaeon]
MVDNDTTQNTVEFESIEKTREVSTFNASLKGLKVLISDEKSKFLYDKGYYGEYDNGVLELEPIEALLLLERRRIHLTDDEGNEYDFKKLAEFYVNKIPNFWTKYLVYKDLRNRGYIVRQGFGEDIEFRVYDRGATVGKSNAKYLIHPVIEGSPLKLSDLSKITKIAKSSRKKLVLTIVDRQGEVIYYQCKEVIL